MAVEISADVREGHRKDLLTHTISPLIQTVLTFQRPQELPAQSRSGNNTLQTLAWIGLGVILLTVPLYLLYTIRRRRSDSGRVESLQRQVRSLFHQG